MTLLQNIGMFLIGIRDSVSLGWVSKVLLYTDPQTKKVHPASKQLFDSLKSSLIKVFLYVIVVPKIFQYLDLLSISAFLKIIYLILTYGYLFFYNNDIMVSTRKVIKWKQKRTPKLSSEVDRVQRIQIFTLLSSQIKSFIFLLFYYLPIFLIETNILLRIPYLGMILLIISQSFFNGVFYFLKTWPYDIFNIGFIEKHFSYMLGYGLFVSIICNYFLSGSFSTGGYLILSLWMLINSVVYSPPQVEFKTVNDIVKVLLDSKERDGLKNAYNLHRQKMRKDTQYRKFLVNNIWIVYPALKITQILNMKASQILKKNMQKQSKQKDQTQEKNKSDQYSTCQNTYSFNNSSVIEEQDEQKEQQSPLIRKQ